MQRHAEKLQRAKEEAALKVMRKTVPDLSPAVWVLALEECSWDAERATVLLNTFESAKRQELSTIQKVLFLGFHTKEDDTELPYNIHIFSILGFHTQHKAAQTGNHAATFKQVILLCL